ncbi:MAG: hypothetical protein HGB11_01295 [Chlorobiales bacterium]|nr:hypothetical protein [Chlorobiales bacterium]
MSQIRVFGFFVLLSICLSGCYTKFSAVDTDNGRADSDQYYGSYDGDYVPPDSLLPEGTTVINNYYGGYYPGPYSRFFGTVGYSGWYDPYYYDSYWYPSAFYFGVGFPYFYYSAYGGWPYRHYYPGHNHYYTGGGGTSSGIQRPHTWGRIRSSYRSPRDLMTMPTAQSSQWGVSNRSVQQQSAPQTTTGTRSVGNASGSSSRVVPTYEYRGAWGGRVRSAAQPGSQQGSSPGGSKTDENKGSQQRANTSSNNSNYKPAERQAPRSYSAPAPSETRGGGGSESPRSSGGGNGGSSGGRGSTRNR